MELNARLHCLNDLLATPRLCNANPKKYVISLNMYASRQAIAAVKAV